MKLKENIFPVVDSVTNKPVDLSKEKQIMADINGQRTEVELKDLFIRHELDGNEIVGFSLLRYFKVKDGVLVDSEGNTVSLYLKDKNVNLKFKDMDVKFVPLDAIEVPLNYIEAFAYTLIGIKTPELIFTDLSAQDKTAITESRNAKELAKKKLDDEAKVLADAKAKADADALARKEEKAKGYEKTLTEVKADAIAKAKADADKAKANALAKAQAEKKLKESINPLFVYEKKDYRNIQEVFKDEHGVEHISEPYHFFHVMPTEENPTPKEPTVLIKRGDDWFQEDEDGELVVENEKTIEYEFSDGDVRKKITVNVENGIIAVENAENAGGQE